MIPLLIAVVTFVTFLPVLSAGFVNWDDDHNIVNNPHLRKLGFEQLAWMFTEAHGGHYQPLTWLSLAVDYQLWGPDQPWGFHLTNLVLHVLTTLSVYLLAVRLIALGQGSATYQPDSALRVAAAVAALLFAVHPLRVESVAWVTERRDVLSGLFFVLSILVYVKAARSFHDGHPHSAWYALSIILCALSLLCKAYAVTLVGVLIVLDIYPLRRFWRHRVRVLVGKTPFLMLSIVFGYLAIWSQEQAGALYSLKEYDFAGRIAQALYGHAFYLGKTVLPISLGPLYNLPSRVMLVGPLLSIGLVIFCAVAVAAVLLYRRFKFFLLGWGWYVIVLLPVSGLLQSGTQLAADRYTYLSCIGWAIAAGAVLHRLLLRSRQSAMRTTLTVGMAGVVLSIVAVLCWRQAGVWHDSETLWRQGVAVSPYSATAHTNLGDALMHKEPSVPDTAMQSYRRALELDPQDTKAYNGAAIAAMALGQPRMSLNYLRAAIRLDPQYAFAHYNLGCVLEGYKLIDEAIVQFDKAYKLDPEFSEAVSKLADLLILRRRYAEAFEVLQSAVAGFADQVYFHSTLSWLLATCPEDRLRNGARALVHADQACQLSARRDPWALDSRAAALAELQRFNEAISTAGRALALAREQGKDDLANQIEQRIYLYQTGQPYRNGM